jgi:hypothetical protein
MSDFLSSLALRSSSSTNDVLPTSKARYQPDANETDSFEVDRAVDSGNRLSSLDTNSYGDTVIAGIAGDHLARRSSSSVDAVVEPSESKTAFERDSVQPAELRVKGTKQLPLPTDPTLIREVVRETRRELEIRTEVIRKGETESVTAPAGSDPFIRQETSIHPAVRNEVAGPTVTPTVPNKPVSTSAHETSESKSVPQAVSEVQQVTQVIEKIREPVVERVTEIVPATSLQLFPPVSLPKPTFESTANSVSSASETVVNVTIGRIEIRAQVEGKRAQKSSAKETSNTDSLREYLSRRST